MGIVHTYSSAPTIRITAILKENANFRENIDWQDHYP